MAKDLDFTEMDLSSLETKLKRINFSDGSLSELKESVEELTKIVGEVIEAVKENQEK